MVIRETLLEPPQLNRMLYCILNVVICLWRYNDTNMSAQHENVPTRPEFFMTLLEFAQVSENAIKIFSLGGGIKPPLRGGGMTLLEFDLVSENAMKNFGLGGLTWQIFLLGGNSPYVCLERRGEISPMYGCGGGGFPQKYYLPELRVPILFL